MTDRLARRVDRARSACGLGVTYRLGKGGFDPRAATPADSHNCCDCSGFAAWVLEISRKPKLTRPWWIETTNICKDATGKQRVFRSIPKPIPGCLVAYPDRKSDGKRLEGHVAVVVDVKDQGGYSAIQIVDCSSSSSRILGDAIQERPGATMKHASGRVYCVLKEDT